MYFLLRISCYYKVCSYAISPEISLNTIDKSSALLCIHVAGSGSEQQLDTGLSDDQRGEEVAGHRRGGPSPHITSKICTFGMLFGK